MLNNYVNSFGISSVTNSFNGLTSQVKSYLAQGDLYQWSQFLTSVYNKAQTSGIKNVSIAEIQALLDITQRKYQNLNSLYQNLAQNKLQTERQTLQSIPDLFRQQQQR